ncbi:hypothetical protein CHUAL_003230 [Chamberlinius hualienensis]
MAMPGSSTASPVPGSVTKVAAKNVKKVMNIAPKEKVNNSDPKEKVIQSVIKLLQRKQGCLRLHEIHENLLKDVDSSCVVFQYSSEGLIKFLSQVIVNEPKRFQGCIINDIVYLVPVFGKKKLKSVLPEAKGVVVYDKSLLEDLPKKAALLHTPLTDILSAKILITLINILETNQNGFNLKNLHAILLQSRGEELKGTELESSLESFKRYLLNHPNEFSISADNNVKCYLSENSDLTSKAVLGVKMTVLLKGGVINIKNLPGHFSNFPSVRQVTGGSAESMKKFILDHQDVFKLESNGDVRITYPVVAKEIDALPPNGKVSVKKKSKNGNTSPNLKSSLRCTQSVVLSVFGKFGFIRFGEQEEDNINFDIYSIVPSSHSTPAEQIDDVKKVLKVGDVVDCMFAEIGGKSKSKYKAYKVWKTPTAIDHGLGLAPIVELPYKVLMGSATVSFLNGDIGSCRILAERKDSLIDFEPKNKADVSSIGFHLGWVIKPKPFSNPLKCGSAINFIARPMLNISGTLSSHWAAVCVWEKLPEQVLEDLESSKAQRIVKAEVRELTTEGGLFSFGSDPWAHRAAFQWDKLVTNRTEFLTFNIGDVFWCVISEAQTNLGSTKWRISQLIAYNVIDYDNPPLNFRHLPLEISVLSTPTKMLLETKDWHKSEDKLAIGKSVDLTDLALVTDQTLLELSKLSLSATVGGMLTSGLGNAEVKDLGPIVVENGLGMIISRDAYGGMLEGDDGAIVYFDAHAFYMQGRPITHLALPERTTVHYEARSNPNDKNSMIAKKVWIGKKPTEVNI